MAKGQRIEKGLLPQFSNIGNAKPQERGVCWRCEKRPGPGVHLIRQEMPDKTVRKLCNDCATASTANMSKVMDHVRKIEEDAMERFRRKS